MIQTSTPDNAKGRSPPRLMETIVLLFLSNRPTNMMNQITRPKPIPWQWKPPTDKPEFPIVQHAGIDYQLIPVQLLEQLKAQNDNLVWLAVGLGAMTIAAGFALVVAFFKPTPTPITIEKPVVITQEKVVPTSCILFCGNSK